MTEILHVVGSGAGLAPIPTIEPLLRSWVIASMDGMAWDLPVKVFDASGREILFRRPHHGLLWEKWEPRNVGAGQIPGIGYARIVSRANPAGTIDRGEHR